MVGASFPFVAPEAFHVDHSTDFGGLSSLEFLCHNLVTTRETIQETGAALLSILVVDQQLQQQARHSCMDYVEACMDISVLVTERCLPREFVHVFSLP